MCGSLPFLRIGTKPAESWCATAPPRMKPRASIPATLSILVPAQGCTSSSMARRKARASPSSVVMSRNMDAGLGVVGIIARIVRIAWGSPTGVYTRSVHPRGRSLQAVDPAGGAPTRPERSRRVELGEERRIARASRRGDQRRCRAPDRSRWGTGRRRARAGKSRDGRRATSFADQRRGLARRSRVHHLGSRPRRRPRRARVPAVEVRDHGDRGVGDLGLAGELGLRHRRHADHVVAERPCRSAIRRVGGELRPLHAHVGAALDEGDALGAWPRRCEPARRAAAPPDAPSTHGRRSRRRRTTTARPCVRSTNWSTRTKSPGYRLRCGTNHRPRQRHDICHARADFKASIFAR